MTNTEISKELAGQYAVIIGASTGIGLATAVLLSTKGADVTITSRSQAKLDAALKQIPGKAVAKAVDGTSEAQMQAFFNELPEFDHLILASVPVAKTNFFKDMNEEEFRRDFDEKFWLYVRAMRLSIGKVRRSITLLTGAAARSPIPTTSGYAATNGALEAMLRPLALEFSPIRLNAVSAGLIDTPFWDKISKESRDAMFTHAIKSLPVQRAGTPDDIAQAIFFAVSNGYTTGTVIECDGGVRLVGQVAPDLND